MMDDFKELSYQSNSVLKAFLVNRSDSQKQLSLAAVMAYLLSCPPHTTSSLLAWSQFTPFYTAVDREPLASYAGDSQS
eukprot:scaffold15373_cov33-Cyclotella_meneghiniana.AAC.1